MFYTRPPIRPKWSPSIGYRLACALLVLLAVTVALVFGRGVLAATTSLDTLIQVLFGDLPASDGVDANNDGAITVADVVLAVPLLFEGVVSDLVPHAVNDQLVYRVTDPQGGLATETTTAVSSDPGGAFVIDDEEVDSQQQVLKHEVQSYTDTGTELLYHGYTDETDPALVSVITCDPPLLRMVMPLIAGQSFSTTIHCIITTLDGTPIGYSDETDVFTPIDIVDSIKVPLGTFTYLVHISGSRQVTGAGLETHEIYFASGVGPVLDLMTIGGQLTRSELVSGTIGGVPVVAH
jgi:hypothetical protein